MRTESLRRRIRELAELATPEAGRLRLKMQSELARRGEDVER